jgi:NAD(P)-dependent dehydrogenase (short-subunit alcohol dehydrogenase family)
MKKSKKYLITGITSGLGEALAEKLLQNGNKVWGIARREVAGKKNLYFSRADLSKSGVWKKVISQMKKKQFIPDVVIFNAAEFCTAARGGFTSQKTRKIFDLNFFSVVEGVETLITNFKSKVRFIAISSSSAFKGSALEGLAYPAGKAALDIAFESYYQKYNGGKYSFSVVHFGPLDTKMNPHKNIPGMNLDLAVNGVMKAVYGGNPAYYFPKMVFLIKMSVLLPAKLRLDLLKMGEKLYHRL